MNTKISKLKIFLCWTVLVVSLAFLLEELVRVSAYVFRAWGFPRVLVDGAVLYKLGEWLVLVPFLVFLLALDGEERRARFATWARWIMLAGAGLCGLAWLDLHWRAQWSWWCIALVIAGLFLFWQMPRRAVRVSGWGPVLLLIFVINLGFSYLTTGYVHVPLPASPPAPSADRDERWRQDLRYLASELPRMHINAYHTTPKAEFDQAVAELDRQIPELSDAQVITGMMRLVAMVGDAHTTLTGQTTTGFHQYPLRMRWFKDGLFVVETTPEYRQALGARVTGIGSVEIEEAYRQVSTLLSHETEGWLRENSPRYLATPEILQALGILATTESGHFTFEDAQGRSFSLDLPAIQKSEQVTAVVPMNSGKGSAQPQWISAETSTPLYRQKAGEDFWYEVLPADGLMYFKYNQCSPFGFGRFNNDLWRAVDENHIERLVVDLRGNGGGSSMQFDAFLQELQMRPALNQPGHLYVFTDRATFSSAVLNAVSLRVQTQATFLGEPPGGSPNGYGDVRSFRLRNSGLTVSYSTRYFAPMPDAPAQLMPDRVIELTSADYFAGRDPLLEEVLGVGE